MFQAKNAGEGFSLYRRSLASRTVLICLIILTPSLGGCAKFFQDPETLINLAVDTDNDGESYTDEYGAEYALGSPSTRGAVTDKLFLGDKSSQPYVAPSGTNYETLLEAHAALNVGFSLPVASRDTNVTAQWDEGWTGKGVKVGVIDDFSDNNTIDSHGDKVSLVLNSVAPEATMLTRHSNLISTDVESGWASMSANGYHIVNNSFGRARVNHINQQVDASFDTDVVTWVNNRFKITGSGTYHEDMLFVFAAGNSGDYCPDRRVHACTFRAAVIHGQRAAGETDSEAYIWVGSLNDAGTALTSYSHSAGEMMNDFIVAHDDVLAKGDGAGTSYAAPRVAGAAAIVRHKFPLLNGMQLKALLLHTAEDIGEEGPDAVFGYGKLDLQNTLSPQGMLTTNQMNTGTHEPQTERDSEDDFGSDRFSIAPQAPLVVHDNDGSAALMTALALIAAPLAASDMSLVHLNINPHHRGAQSWRGQFTGPNGRAYNVTHLYDNRGAELSGTAILAKPINRDISLLLPFSFDAGYDSALLETQPLAGFGIGAAIELNNDTSVSMRVDNVLTIGGESHERPCYDTFQRRFHCGTGKAWTDYITTPRDTAAPLGTTGFQARIIRRF